MQIWKKLNAYLGCPTVTTNCFVCFHPRRQWILERPIITRNDTRFRSQINSVSHLWLHPRSDTGSHGVHWIAWARTAKWSLATLRIVIVTLADLNYTRDASALSPLYNSLHNLVNLVELKPQLEYNAHFKSDDKHNYVASETYITIPIYQILFIINADFKDIVKAFSFLTSISFYILDSILWNT